MRTSPLLLGLLLIGCAGGNDLSVIRSDAEYGAANEKVRTLVQPSFTKLDRGETLTDFDKQQLKEATKMMDAMIAYIPDNFSLFLQAGTVALALDDNETAVARFNDFQTYIPNDMPEGMKPLVTDGFFQFSVALFRVGRLEDSLVAVDRALQDEPKNPKFITHKGSVLVQLGDLAAAKKELKRALELAPENSRAESLLKFIEGKDKG